MAFEFHTLRGTCSTLVPQGPRSENVWPVHQVCTTIGSVPGLPYVEGERFVQWRIGSILWVVRCLRCLVLLFEGY
jgi:hypothetical protein